MIEQESEQSVTFLLGHAHDLRRVQFVNIQTRVTGFGVCLDHRVLGRLGSLYHFRKGVHAELIDHLTHVGHRLIQRR